MKKSLLILTVFAVILLLIALLFLFKDDSGKDIKYEKSENNSAIEEIKDDIPTIGEASLKDLLSKGVNMECGIKYKVDGSTEDVQGTYFTGYGKMRGDFIIDISGKESVSSMILDGDVLYSWSEIDGEKYGVKIDTKVVAEQQSQGQAPETNEPVPLEDVVNYDCKPWAKVDESIFEPPSDIIFKDFNSIINAGMEFGTIYEENPSKEESCKVCAQVSPGEGRDSCMAAFNCQ